MASIITRFAQARHSYWRVDDNTPIGALFCILQADVRALAPAAQLLRYEYKGALPLRLKDWADAIDATYLAGF